MEIVDVTRLQIYSRREALKPPGVLVANAMTGSKTSPVSWVQLLQALVARELVEELGVSSTRAAQLLGIATSAVSQYRSGRRLRGPFLVHSTDPRARRVARRVAERLVDPAAGRGARIRALLDGAGTLADAVGGHAAVTGEPETVTTPTRRSTSRRMAQWVRARERTEQNAVTGCMRLAQKARDELTRAIFRQIASDSLRHAEIVASLAPYLDRGIVRAHASGVTKREVELLIRAEREAESGGDSALLKEFGGTMALLLESMEADERKHTGLLEGLVRSGFVP
jgi:uncharacterized protein